MGTGDDLSLGGFVVWLSEAKDWIFTGARNFKEAAGFLGFRCSAIL